MNDFSRNAAATFYVLCPLASVVILCVAIQLLIRGMPTHREYCDLEANQLRFLVRLGTVLLLAILAVWCVVAFGVVKFFY